MRLYRPLLLVAALLAFGVISLGAYVRLSDAGLGCPDWPGCYGHLIGVPDAAHERATALVDFPGKPVEAPKAWKEMVHRYFAGMLGLLIALIAVLSWKYRRSLQQSPLLPSVLLGIVGMQALLGMWTVTLLLKPVIVSAHLLGGMMTLAMLVWLFLAQHGQASHSPIRATSITSTKLRWLAILAVFALVIQIALGGWVSSNYAAFACGIEFPSCLGSWRPEMDFAQAFQLHRELGQTADGSLLSMSALAAIHWAHRLGALIVTVILGWLTILLLRRPGWRSWGLLLGFALLAQVGLGIANVRFILPLHLAVAHNTGASLLLTVTLALTFRLWHVSHRFLPRETVYES